MTDGAATLKGKARQAGIAIQPEMVRLARILHEQPELSGEETQSSRLVASTLSAAGFTVEFGTGGMATAFDARCRLAGEGPVVAFLAEYDALPDIGHGCGHNLIAAAAAGAGLVLSQVAAGCAGEVRVIGTPAEETLGGKVVLVESGAFEGIDVALMVHPGHEDRVLSDSLACASFEVVFSGTAAHAVAHPEKGINALDALLALFAARDDLLRHSRAGARLPGVITDGGKRPNIVPERAAGSFSLRARDRTRLDELVGGFRRLAEGIAATRHCGVEIRQTDRTYDDMQSNIPLADAYRANLAALGVGVNDRPRESMGSLDMGNVSYTVPSLHPFFAIVPPTVASHTREFATATLGEAGAAGLLRSMQALAMTGVDVLCDDGLLRRARDAHAAVVAERRTGAE